MSVASRMTPSRLAPGLDTAIDELGQALRDHDPFPSSMAAMQQVSAQVALDTGLIINMLATKPQIKAGDFFPDAEVYQYAPTGAAACNVLTKHSNNSLSLFRGRVVVVLGLPSTHMPDNYTSNAPQFLKAAQLFKEKAVELFFLSTNNVYQMHHWLKEKDPTSSVRHISDPTAKLTSMLGMLKKDPSIGAFTAEFSMVLEETQPQQYTVRHMTSVTNEQDMEAASFGKIWPRVLELLKPSAAAATATGSEGAATASVKK